MIRKIRQKQTLASFDYQWKEIGGGDALLTDAWFAENVERIITDELLCLRPEWFEGKRVLDAGAGNGRWTVGLLGLGCHVTAVDASAHALEGLEAWVARLMPEARERLEVQKVDLLDLPPELAARSFDLVFSFGVLHHTGDTRAALRNVASLVGSDGVLFLYLYGRRSFTTRQRAMLGLRRFALAPLPFELKKRLIARRAGAKLHEAFDALSPAINTRHTFDEVRDWVRAEGFPDPEQTIVHPELFVRAGRRPEALGPFEVPRPTAPYWFERTGMANAVV